MNKYHYDLEKYNFPTLVKNHLHIDKLEDIHILSKQKIDIPENPSQDQQTIFHKLFYSIYENDSKILELYQEFVQKEICKRLERTDIIYQSRPTFRVHAPGGIAVAKWHKDKEYNHSINEINIFLPLTKAFDNNTIWSESIEDLGDYAPMNADVGEYYIWDGANLSHGNKTNDTTRSRVSLDFRIIFKDKFNYSGTSVTTKVPMKIGYYWSELCSN
jgi:hypothetical protein